VASAQIVPEHESDSTENGGPSGIEEPKDDGGGDRAAST
jgi:hypothetical protein